MHWVGRSLCQHRCHRPERFSGRVRCETTRRQRDVCQWDRQTKAIRLQLQAACGPRRRKKNVRKQKNSTTKRSNHFEMTWTYMIGKLKLQMQSRSEKAKVKVVGLLVWMQESALLRDIETFHFHSNSQFSLNCQFLKKEKETEPGRKGGATRRKGK